MRPTVSPVVRSTIALGILVVALTSCADQGTTGTEPVAQTSAPEDSTSTDSGWEDESDPELRLRGCLIGTWTLDREAWTTGITSILRGSGIDSVSIEDSGALSFVLNSDETYTLTGEDSRTVSQGRSPDGEMLWSLRFDGTETGSWSVADGRLTLVAGTEGRLAGEHELSFDGQSLPTDMLSTSGTPWSEVLDTTCDAERIVANPTNEPEAVDVVLIRTD